MSRILETNGRHQGRAPRIGLVLGGGALKGLAHVGVLRALAEAGIQPALFAGTSIGAMIAAAAASGMPTDRMLERALQFRRRDLFRINHFGMLMERMLSRSIYLESPLRALCEELVHEGTFADLHVPLLVTAVDIDRGIPVVFGRPGLTDVRVRDAVYASCALPGFFPPGVVAGRSCIDGGTTDNLPVAIAALDVDAIIAVDVGIADVPVASGVATQGFASIFMRAATMMMHEQQQHALERWSSPPMLLIRPKVSHIGWFSFGHTEELLAAGYDATREALHDLDELLRAPGGIFPKRSVELSVDRDACTGCGQCVARAPRLMALDVDLKAYPLSGHQVWSPADGAFLRGCPVGAIHLR
ncbi:MAG: patatin-like phospholipase family protein [Gemmatimonadaceae bacterium]|nr:patatin-like phospholipase family protein [Gemmatimonadaceae bacterium]